MCVCAHVCARARDCVRVCICACVRVCISACVCVYRYVCVCVYVYIYVCVFNSIHVCVYVLLVSVSGVDLEIYHRM